MDQSKLKYQFQYPKLAEYVEYLMDNNACGHDFWHVYRVCEMSRHLADTIDVSVNYSRWIEILALTHDLFDDKVIPVEHRPRIVAEVETILTNNHTIRIPYNLAIEDIQRIATGLRWSNTGEDASLAEKIVMDADRLDAIGAIGIARAAAYGGAHKMLLYDADAPEMEYTSGSVSRSTISHCYDKLQHVKERIFTEAAKPIAEYRHAFMMSYLEQFKSEIHGN